MHCAESHSCQHVLLTTNFILQIFSWILKFHHLPVWNSKPSNFLSIALHGIVSSVSKQLNSCFHIQDSHIFFESLKSCEFEWKKGPLKVLELDVLLLFQKRQDHLVYHPFNTARLRNVKWSHIETTLLKLLFVNFRNLPKFLFIKKKKKEKILADLTLRAFQLCGRAVDSNWRGQEVVEMSFIWMDGYESVQRHVMFMVFQVFQPSLENRSRRVGRWDQAMCFDAACVVWCFILDQRQRNPACLTIDQEPRGCAVSHQCF